MTDTPTDELCFTPAATLARLIATRQVSPVAVTEAVLARAAQVEPALNIFALPMADAARADAQAAEAAVMRGDTLGPLHGVPITIKDNVPIAGLPLANGSAAFADFVPAADAAVVRRIRAAGAIIIGKTNLPEFAHKVLTDSPVYGVTRNPWNLAHTPGGSSGGASAALAAGVAPLAVGTDGGGSHPLSRVVHRRGRAEADARAGAERAGAGRVRQFRLHRPDGAHASATRRCCCR